MNIRKLAVQVIGRVLSGTSLSAALSQAPMGVLEPRDKAFVQALSFGVCRYYPRLQWLAAQLLPKALRKKDCDIEVLIFLGLYQLTYMRIPAHAVVHETVSVVQNLKKPWARGLVNGVLRNYLRQESQLSIQLMQVETAAWMHPTWWIHHIRAAWPHHWQAILSANNAFPPLALRVNQRYHPREQYQRLLKALDKSSTIIPFTTHGLIIDEALPVHELPGFAEGKVSVQDGAAQLAATFLQLHPGQRVLDACAAPGGKLMHILESQANLAACIALEKDNARCQTIHDNAHRLGLNPEIICHDATDTSWWDGKLFDRILIDAPCSASGVIRRHPDIKLLRRESDVAELAKIQSKILLCLWPLLKVGGLLLYATCSIFPAENSAVIANFLHQHKDARKEKLPPDIGIQDNYGLQILPGMHHMDGFYYALLRKHPEL